MRSILRTAVVVAASLLLVPQFVAAADLDVEIQDMKQRLEAMESQIQAQSAELTDARAMVAAQQVQIDQTETLVTDERDAVSALSSFLESTDISGFVAAGWNYADTNTDDNVDGTSSFNLDQAWITMNKASTADSRAGFNLELQMGQDALESKGGVGDNSTVGVYAASVNYLAPVGSGLLIDAGILATALGAEVEAQNGNWQISRGAVFALQPITNTGATASYGLTDNISVMVGVLNDPFASDRNNTDGSLGLTSQVSYSQDNFGLNVGYNYGSGAVVDERNGILDIVATLDVNDNISAWVNYDYVTNETAAGADGPSTQGLAVAGRVGVMDGTGISGRFEYVSTSDGTDVETDKQTTYTVTVDHALTAGLTGKFEYRYNDVDLAGGGAGNPGNEIAVQLLYEF